ncbi:hypothetical protein FH972_025206 [Carpinus fangiana]|uniref:Chromo domain-containing protein n=1 Tax=Carpinus fangiana TaxID=176857 RepID=A0A5N6L0C1_9ROSI|nr:hypothetical protein FH972_025206 [Carpinus fangiana]
MAISPGVQTIRINNVSDADPAHRPTGWKLVEPPHRWLEKLAHAWLAEQRKTIDPNVRYYLDRLPRGYAVFERGRPRNSSVVDKHLYGHPSHMFFDSPNRFTPHFLHLMRHGTNAGCPCTICNAQKGRPLPILSVASSATPGSAGSPTLGTGPNRLSQAASQDLSEPLSSHQSQPLVHRRLPPAVLRTRDEEDTPDMVRWLIDRLKQEKRPLDEPIEEPLSMDWRAEHVMLDTEISTMTRQQAWMPRKAEIVLFLRSVDGEVCFDNASNTYKLYDERRRLFTGYPKWEAAVVGQTPSEFLSLQDLIRETHESQTNPIYSGFRLEPIPDPNNFEHKEWTKRYKYVPLHQVRPFAFWQEFMAGIPECEWHPTIVHALKCMSSFALSGRYRFKGDWPTATVFHKAMQIGAEVIAIGDALRLLPNATSSVGPDDLLVLHVTSIRLQLSHLDAASANDYEIGTPYESSALVAGKAYTLSGQFAFNPDSSPVDPLTLPRGMLGRVAGRCFEADALFAWHPWYSIDAGPRNAPLSIGLDGTMAAREYAKSHDARIDRAQGKSWFWADTRAELLGITTLNGIAVNAWAGMRSADDLDEARHAINVLEKGASKADRQRMMQQKMKHEFAKWQGWEDSTWEPAESIRADVPDMVREFERNAGNPTKKDEILDGADVEVDQYGKGDAGEGPSNLALFEDTSTSGDYELAKRIQDEEDARPVDEGDEYVVERLIRKRREPGTGTQQYEVKWQGYGWDETTWEPASSMAEDAPDLVRQFEKKLRASERGRDGSVLVSSKGSEHDFKKWTAPAPKVGRRNGHGASVPTESRAKTESQDDQDEEEEDSDSSTNVETKHHAMLAAFRRGAEIRARRASSHAASQMTGVDAASQAKDMLKSFRQQSLGATSKRKREDTEDTPARLPQKKRTESPYGHGKAAIWLDGASAEDQSSEHEGDDGVSGQG